VPRYGDEPDEPGIIRVAGRPVPGDPEDRLVGWRAMHRTVLEAAQDCDLIHIQTPFIAQYAGLKAARTLGLPVVATYHTLFEEYLQHYAPLAAARAGSRAVARALSRAGSATTLDAVIVPSTAMQHCLKSYGVTRADPCAADRHSARPLWRRQRPGIPVPAWHSLLAAYRRCSSGGWPMRKNIRFLLEACSSECPPIATGYPPADQLAKARPMDDLKAQRQWRARLASTTVRVSWAISTGKQALPDCYAAANAFVFASRTETQGLVLLEAMAMPVYR
jgi:1,2-diacylglycerol 3-alpha-glucosyltransferase